MADKINKVRVDGKDYLIGIGEQLGAELEWKLVASGTYDSTFSNEQSIVYKLDKYLEPDKLYYIERYDSQMDIYENCFMKTRLNNTWIETKCKGVIIVYDDNDTMVDGYVNLTSRNFGTEEHCITIDSIVNIYQSPYDTLKVYELTIKNVENPSNVETLNKMKLVATGTWKSNAFVLDNKLEWNKTYLYNIDFDPASQNMSGVLPLFNTHNYEEYQIFCSGAVYIIDEDETTDGHLSYNSDSNSIEMFDNNTGLIEGSGAHLEDLKIYIYELPFTL